MHISKCLCNSEVKIKMCWSLSGRAFLSHSESSNKIVVHPTVDSIFVHNEIIVHLTIESIFESIKNSIL